MLNCILILSNDLSILCGYEVNQKNRGSKFAPSAAKLQAPVERDEEGAVGRRKWLIRPLGGTRRVSRVSSILGTGKTSRGPAGG